MTEQQVAEQQMTEVPMAIHTKWATIAVFGHELVSKRDIEILSKCLTLPEWENDDHGVRMVMFRDDDYPVDGVKKPILANCELDAKAITINLNHHWRRTIRLCAMEAGRGLQATWHQMLIQSVLHEVHHLSMAVCDRKTMFNGNSLETLEELAEEFAEATLYAMAKATDLEPSLWHESPFLSSCILSTLQTPGGEIPENEVDEWFSNQQWMLDNRVSFYLPAEEGETHPVTFQSFKSYCQLLANEEGDSSWDADTAGKDEGKSLAGKIVYELTADSVTSQSHETTAASQHTIHMHQTDPAAYEPMTDDEYLDDYLEGSWAAQAAAGTTQYQQQPIHQQNVVQQNATQNTMWTPNGQQTAATPAQGQTRTQNTTPFMPLDMDPETNLQVIKNVCMKVYNHIFTVCQPTNAHGVEKPFLWAEGATHQAIELTEQEKLVCPLMDCQDTNGSPYFGVGTGKGLLGKLSQNKALPMYVITFNYCGQAIKRSLVPQNPAKLKDFRNPASGYSATAIRAQEGNAIMHIMEADKSMKEANKQAGRSDWKNKIENGHFHS